MPNPVGTRQWATYIDLDEAQQYLKLHEALSAGREALLQRFIDSACTQAQNRANRPLGPNTFRERHDGWSGEYIMLRWSPFLGLVKATEWQSTGGPINLPECTPETNVEGIQIDYATSRVMRTFGYNWPKPFFPGSRNIEITYQAGFNPIPPDIWEATMELIMWKWRNSQQPARTEVLAGSDFSDTGASDGLFPGMPNRIAEVFDTYWMPSI